MGRDLKDLKVVSCHLGNGSSITAVQDGKSVDTTMGFTPLDGVLMGTRCGAVDPSAVTYVAGKHGFGVSVTSPQQLRLATSVPPWQRICWYTISRRISVPMPQP